MAKVYPIASTDAHSVLKSTGLSCHRSGEKKKINEVANNTKGFMDQFPFTPWGGFHLEEN